MSTVLTVLADPEDVRLAEHESLLRKLAAAPSEFEDETERAEDEQCMAECIAYFHNRRRSRPICVKYFAENSPDWNVGALLAEISWIRSDFHFFPPPAGRNSLNCKPRIFQNPQVETYSLPHRSLKVIFCPLKKCFCVSTLAKKTARCIATGASSKTADCALVTPLNAPSFT